MGRFGLPLVPVAIALLPLALGDVGDIGPIVVGGLLYICAIVAFFAPVVLVAAAILYGAYLLARRFDWFLGRLRLTPFCAVGFVVGNIAVWSSVSSELDTSAAKDLVLAGALTALASLVLWLLTAVFGGSRSKLHVADAGLLIGSERQYVPFADLSGLCVVRDGAVESTFVDGGPRLGEGIDGVKPAGRWVAAFNRRGERVVLHALIGSEGSRFESRLIESYDAWERCRGGERAVSWLERGGSSLLSWLGRLAEEGAYRAGQRTYRGMGCGIEALLDAVRDTSLPQDVRGGAAYVLLLHLPADQRGRVFELIGESSPPLLSALAWCAARASTRRRTNPHWTAWLAEEDRRALLRFKRGAWLTLLGARGGA